MVIIILLITCPMWLVRKRWYPRRTMDARNCLRQVSSLYVVNSCFRPTSCERYLFSCYDIVQRAVAWYHAKSWNLYNYLTPLRRQRVKSKNCFKHTLVQFLCKTIATNNKMCKWLYNVNYENCCTTSITNTGRGHRKFFSAYNKCELGWKVFTREPEKPTNSISFVILVGKRFLFKTPCKIRKSWFWVNWKRNVAFFKWLLSSTMMIMIMIARYYLGGSKDIRRLKVPTPRRTPP